MRTRGNGEPLSIEGLLEDARELDWERDVEVWEWNKDLHEVIGRERQMARQAERGAFDDGFQLGAKVEHRVAVEAVVTAALHILGKDIGDGEIDLGSLGRWWPSYEVAIGPGERPSPLDYRESIGGASK